MLLCLARNLIDRKAISRFILNSHAAALQGCRRATTVVTPTEARRARRAEKRGGERRDPVAYTPFPALIHTHTNTCGTSVLTCDRGKGSYPFPLPAMGCQFWARLRTRRIR